MLIAVIEGAYSKLIFVLATYVISPYHPCAKYIFWYNQFYSFFCFVLGN